MRRHYGRPLGLVGRDIWSYRLVRLAAVLALGFVAGWGFILSRMVTNRIDFFTSRADAWFLVLPVLGVGPMAGMLMALVHAAASLRRVSSWPARAGNLLIAAAFAGLAWFAIEHNLIRFSLAY